METELIISFLGASILLTFMPGPDNILVLTESITKGKKNGIALSVGLGTGVLIHTLAAATGLSLIIQEAGTLFHLIKYLGAAYLLYLAFKSFKEKAPEYSTGTVEEMGAFSFFKLARKGFFMNVLNPKVTLFFIAFLPQFVSKGGMNITIQMVVLGLLFMIQAILIFSLISILSGRLNTYLASKKFWQITKWGKVSVLGSLGIALALTE